METITTETLQYIESSEADGFWIHFDTDVLADDVNPAVDYRLPGGLLPSNVEHIIKHLLLTGRMAGMSITIFNPALDTHGHISKSITNCLGRAFGAALI